MSSPTTTSTPAMNFTLKCVCSGCSRTLYDYTVHSEQEVKEHTAKMITASEVHDCKSSPK